MPVQKIDKTGFLVKCWEVFHKNGYHNTSMQDLAQATGLQKAGLYHHYPTKHLLMKRVIEFALDQFRSYVLSVAHDTSLPIEQRFEKMLRRQRRLALKERRGCFFANLALETGRDEMFNQVLLRSLDEWAEALSTLYAHALTPEAAMDEARRVIMEYEGAVVFFKLTDDEQFLEAFVQRAVKAFPPPSISLTINNATLGI
jgi:TetR/AcrR family transcriptional regulator, transcriptional repressor for nem operon